MLFVLTQRSELSGVKVQEMQESVDSLGSQLELLKSELEQRSADCEGAEAERQRLDDTCSRVTDE